MALLAACGSDRPSMTLSPVFGETASPGASPSPVAPVAPATETATTAPPTQAVPTAWQRTNPGGGGAFNTIGAGPTGIILVASDLSGVYLSRDRGATWQPIGARQGLTVTHASGLGFDPQDPDVLYVGTEEGLFRSQDQGVTFRRVLDHGYITHIAMAPSNPDIGYLAHHSRFDVADATVYRTQDRGRTWERVSGPTLPQGLHVLELEVHPERPDTVFALAGEGRFACGPAALFMSTDGGHTWQRLAEELGQVLDVALDPALPDGLFLSTYGDVWDPGYRCIQDDPQGGYVYHGVFDGESWTWEAWSDQEDLAARNWLLWADADDDHALRVIDLDYPEIWETRDRGATWQRLGDKSEWDWGWTGETFAYGTSFNGDAKTLGRDLSDPDALLWADSQFVWVTRDDGRTFFPLHTQKVGPGRWRSTGVDNIVTYDLALDADGRHVYLAMTDMGCFRSPDRGVSWQICNDVEASGSWEGYGGNAFTVLADPARPGRVWMTLAEEIDLPHTLLHSTDHGATWTPARGLPEEGMPSGLSLDPHSPTETRTLFITWGGDVYRSQDDGRTWQRVLDCGGCRTTAVDPHDGSRVYAGGEAGLWRSTQGGEPGTWEAIGLPSMQGTLGDAFWDTYWEGVSDVEFDPEQPGRVYVAVFGEGRGLYRSEDGGETWEHVLADAFLWDVLVAPWNPRHLYIASSSALHSGGYHPESRGVRFSPDRGRTWQDFNQGLVWPFAKVLQAMPASPPLLWVGSPGLGYAYRTPVSGNATPP